MFIRYGVEVNAKPYLLRFTVVAIDTFNVMKFVYCIRIKILKVLLDLLAEIKFKSIINTRTVC